MDGIDDDYEIIDKPSSIKYMWGSLWVSAWVYGRFLHKVYDVGKSVSLLITRLTWIHCSMAPLCPPKVAFCASVVVVLAFSIRLARSS
jgi:hypothetical protein